MEEELITFQVANLIKEFGFNEPVRFYYTLNCENPENYSPESMCGDWHPIYDINKLACPTQELLHKWFREKVGIYISPYFDLESYSWNIEINYLPNRFPEKCILNKIFKVKANSYEEAMEVGFIEAIILVTYYCNSFDKPKSKWW